MVRGCHTRHEKLLEKGRGFLMGKILISNDLSGHIIVSFPYDSILFSKIKTIDGGRWHPAERHWSFQHLLPSPLMGEGKGGGEEIRIACLSGRQGTVPGVYVRWAKYAWM